MEYRESYEFERAKKEAEELSSQTEELKRTLDAALLKAKKHRDNLKKIWNDLHLLIEFVRAYAQGEYRRVPWKVILYATAAILYFLNPFDLVPDFFAGLGFVDDATVIAFVVAAIRDELEKFKMQRKIIITPVEAQ